MLKKVEGVPVSEAEIVEYKVIVPKSVDTNIVQASVNGHIVEFNTAEFELLEECYYDSRKGYHYLHYVGGGGVVKNPKGNISAYRMFDRDPDRYKDLQPLNKLIYLSQFDTHFITDMGCMFANFDRFVDWVVGIGNFDTSNVEIMSGMFSKSDCCNSRKTILDLRNFNTSKVKDMYQMFEGTYLKDIIVSSFDTSNVEDMGSMFECTKVAFLDLRNFSTSKVKDVGSMFLGCSDLKELRIGTFDLSNVVNTSLIFEDSFCESAEPLDLSNLYISQSNESVLDGILEDCNAGCVVVSSTMYPIFEKYRGNYKNKIVVKDIDFNLLDRVYSAMCFSTEEDIFKNLKAEGCLDKDIASSMYTINPNSKIALGYCNKVVLPKLSKDLMGGDKKVGEVLAKYYGKYPKVLVDATMSMLLSEHYIV